MSYNDFPKAERLGVFDHATHLAHIVLDTAWRGMPGVVGYACIETNFSHLRTEIAQLETMANDPNEHH